MEEKTVAFCKSSEFFYLILLEVFNGSITTLFILVELNSLSDIIDNI